MGDVDKAAEFGILRALCHPLAFCAYTAFVIGLFNFDKYQRHAVYQQGDVRAEFFVAVDAEQFGYDMEAVVVEILEIDQLDAGAADEAFVKLPSQVFVVQLDGDVGQQAARVVFG